MITRLLSALSLCTLPLSAVTPAEIENLQIVSPSLTASGILALASDGTTLAAIDSRHQVMKSTDNGRNWVRSGKIVAPAGLTFPNISGLVKQGANWIATGNFRAISTDLQTWDSGTINPTISAFASVHAEGRTVIVGSSGKISYSTDGISWTATTSNGGIGFDQIRGIAHGAGTFVAAAENGKIITSPDGITWSIAVNGIPTRTGIADDFDAVTFLNGIFFATGRNGLLMTSADAVTWSLKDTVPANVPFDTLGRPVRRTDGGTIFPVRFGRAVLSTDLTNFTRIDLPGSVLISKALPHNGTLVAVSTLGKFAYSDDGATWTQTGDAIGSGFTSVTYGDGVFIAMDSVEDRLLSSPDGAVWTVEATSAVNIVERVVYGPTGFVVRLTDDSFLYRPNGQTTWSPLSLDTLNANTPSFIGLLGAANGRWLGMTGDRVISSTNLTTWTNWGTYSPPFRIEEITYGNGTYVAVGAAGNIISSTNLLTWQNATPAGSNQFFAVTHDGWRFITSSLLPFTSTDGVTWTKQQLTGQFVLGENFLHSPGNATYSFGGSGALSYNLPTDAPDHWASVSYPADPTLRDGAEGNGVFVAVGDEGLIMITPALGPAYRAWATSFFGANALPETVSPYFDADADGVPNIVEYGEGTNPNGKTARQEPTASFATATVALATFEQVAGLNEVVGIIEYSKDLRIWSSNGVTRTSIPLPGGRERIESRLTGNTALPPLFMRLHWKPAP